MVASPPDTAVCSPLNCSSEYCYVNKKRPAEVTFPAGRFLLSKGLTPVFLGISPCCLWKTLWIVWKTYVTHYAKNRVVLRFMSTGFPLRIIR